MTRLLVTFLLLMSTLLTQAQIHEIGVGLGGTNFIGDIGSTQYIKPSEVGVSAYYRLNRSPRHSFRLSYLNTKLKGDDFKADDAARKSRGLKFSNNIQQLSAGIEFNFFEFNLHEEQFGLTPYIYGGLSVIQYDDLHYRPFISGTEEVDAVDLTLIKGKKKYTLGIPFAVGLKLRVTSQLNLNAEIMANYTYTDNLDGSHPKGINSAYTFGKGGKDWFVFSGISLSYTFGKNPCYCAN